MSAFHAASIPQTVLQRLKNDYAKLVPERLDLFNDVGASEIFIVEGDSLLLDLMNSDSRIDWSLGGQFLHLVYLVERFFHLFKERTGNFRVVFFQHHRTLYLNTTVTPPSLDYSKLLAREMIIRHLQQNTDIHVDVFDTWMGEENQTLTPGKWNWQACLALYPAFVVVSDGEVLDSACATNPDQYSAFILRSFLFNVLSQKTAAVYCSTIDLDNNRLMGFTVSARVNERAKAYEDHTKTIVTDRLETLQKLLQVNIPETFSNDTAGNFAEKVALAAISNLEQDDQIQDLAKIALLHHTIQNHLPLKFRAQSTTLTIDGVKRSINEILDTRCPSAKKFIHEYHKNAAAILLHYSANENRKSSTPDASIANFWDGRLFALLAVFLSCKGSIENADQLGLPTVIANATMEKWNFARSFFPLFVGHASTSLQPETKEDQPADHKLFSITHPLVNSVLGDAFNNVAVYSQEEEEKNISDAALAWRKFPVASRTEDAFWTGILKSYESTGTSRTNIRQQQNLVRFIHKYAESLSGSVSLHQKPLVVDAKGRIKSADASSESSPETPPKAAAKKGGGGKPKGGGKAPKKSKKEEIIEKQMALRQKKAEEDAKMQWENVKKSIEHLVKTKQPHIAERQMEEFLRTCPVSSVVLEAAMYQMNYYYQRWRSALLAATATKTTVQIKIGKVKESIEDAIKTFNNVHKIIDHHMDKLDKDKLTTLQKVLIDMGFVDSAELVARDLGKPLDVDIKSGLVAPRSSVLFQLEHMGHLLRRKESTGPDKRVGFVPDRWQKELLDLVDKRGSALVCAPTASGKTFISYYAMEQVLRESNDGIAVYVSPTKALVNQVAAEVYARFGTLQQYLSDGMSVYGYFTQDYRYKALESRVLVTVPECFELLLLSPQFEDWRKKLRYVIFDEVHSIGDLASGEAWEHTIALVDCPFLALSATVGNPEDLKLWMQAKQRMVELQHKKHAKNNDPNRSYEFALIYHHNRHSDLEKYVFLPGVRDQPLHLDSVWEQVSDKAKFVRIHPLACLTAPRIRDRGLPNDLVLEPRDCLALFNTMWAVAKTDLKDPEYRSRLEQLHPEAIDSFVNSRRINRPQARAWEQQVKEELVRWATTGYEDLVTKVLNQLGSEYHSSLKQNDEEWLEKKQIRTDSVQYLKQNIGELLATLAHQDKLPAIVFCWNKHLCEQLAAATLEWLEQEDYRKSNTSEAVKERRNREKLLRQQERKNKMMRDAQLKAKSALEQVVREADEIPVGEESPVDPELSFASDEVNILEETQDVVRSYPSKLAWVRGLQRGIGVHHASLPTKYRQTVERLFRLRGLQVVFATSTLSLGINMPCKTVVFAGDDVHLNALSYRQMSGRAGRRGFDKLGRIVFFGIPDAKINRLLTGDLQTLQGNFPVTTSLVQRSFDLIYHSKDKQAALDATSRLYHQPWTPYISAEQSKSAFRIAVNYLIKQGMLKNNGDVVGFADHMTYLYWTEPANFTLLSLIYSKVLQSMCDESKVQAKGLDVVAKEVMTIFASFVAPIYSHRSILYNPNITGGGSPSSISKVVLERLPDEVRSVLQQHNREVIKHFVATIKSVLHGCPEGFLKLVDELPMSKLTFNGTDDLHGDFINLLQSNAIKTDVRSPFVALSGHSDDFHSIEDLVASARQGIPVDLSTLPVVRIPQESSPYVINRYAVDFFEHGQLDLLRKQNGIQGDGPWNALKTFVSALTGFVNVVQKVDRQMGRVCVRLLSEFEGKFNKITWFS